MRTKLEFSVLRIPLVKFIDYDIKEKINGTIIGVETKGNILGITIFVMKQFYDETGEMANMDELLGDNNEVTGKTN